MFWRSLRVNDLEHLFKNIFELPKKLFYLYKVVFNHQTLIIYLRTMHSSWRSFEGQLNVVEGQWPQTLFSNIFEWRIFFVYTKQSFTIKHSIQLFLLFNRLNTTLGHPARHQTIRYRLRVEVDIAAARCQFFRQQQVFGPSVPGSTGGVAILEKIYYWISKLNLDLLEFCPTLCSRVL